MLDVIISLLIPKNFSSRCHQASEIFKSRFNNLFAPTPVGLKIQRSTPSPFNSSIERQSKFIPKGSKKSSAFLKESSRRYEANLFNTLLQSSATTKILLAGRLVFRANSRSSFFLRPFQQNNRYRNFLGQLCLLLFELRLL